MFTAITHAAILRTVNEQGSSRCLGTFAPAQKDVTLRVLQRKCKKLRWAITPAQLSWGYDVLGATHQ